MNETARKIPPWAPQKSQLLILEEPEYRYGVGRLRLAVDRLFDVSSIDGQDWIRVSGYEVRSDGEQTMSLRTVLVSRAAIEAQPQRQARGNAPS